MNNSSLRLNLPLLVQGLNGSRRLLRMIERDLWEEVAHYLIVNDLVGEVVTNRADASVDYTKSTLGTSFDVLLACRCQGRILICTSAGSCSTLITPHEFVRKNSNAQKS